MLERRRILRVCYEPRSGLAGTIQIVFAGRERNVVFPAEFGGKEVWQRALQGLRAVGYDGRLWSVGRQQELAIHIGERGQEFADHVLLEMEAVVLTGAAKRSVEDNPVIVTFIWGDEVVVVAAEEAAA